MMNEINKEVRFCKDCKHCVENPRSDRNYCMLFYSRVVFYSRADECNHFKEEIKYVSEYSAEEEEEYDS